MGSWWLELVVLIAFLLLLLGGAVLFWRKRRLGACMAIGAAAGMLGPVFIFGFQVAISSYDALIFFRVLDPDGFDPLWYYPDAASAERVAAFLNAILVVVSAAMGALLGLGVGCMTFRRRTSFGPPESGV